MSPKSTSLRDSKEPLFRPTLPGTPCGRGHSLASVLSWLTLSLTASHCKHSASVSGNLCIRQFPGPPRSKFGLANSCPPIKAWQSEGRGGGKNKWPLAIGRTHFEGRERPAPGPGPCSRRMSRVGLSLDNSGLRTVAGQDTRG